MTWLDKERGNDQQSPFNNWLGRLANPTRNIQIHYRVQRFSVTIYYLVTSTIMEQSTVYV